MKVYWSRCGPGHGNFGDRLLPLFLEHCHVPFQWAPVEHALLFGPGSVLEHVPSGFRGTVWTTGLMHAESRKDLSHARVLGLRGRLTCDRVTCANRDQVCLGDAGLLCDMFHKPGPRRFRLGLIPHYVDTGDPVLADIAGDSSETVVIDICAAPLDVIRAVGECENVISSSLHGLILADSLGIPNRWISLNRGAEVVRGGGFKFHDYYSVFGLHAEPLELNASDTVDTIVPRLGGYHRPGIADIKARLREKMVELVDSLPRPTPQQRAAEMGARKEWARRLEETKRILGELLPRDAALIIADDDQIRGELVNRTLPFVERDGAYWGPPPDDATAIRELERLRATGARYFAVTWPAFWWLDHYTGFRAHLYNSFRCISRDERIILFDLN